MVTYTIRLSDEVAAAIEMVARSAGVTAEQLLEASFTPCEMRDEKDREVVHRLASDTVELAQNMALSERDPTATLYRS